MSLALDPVSTPPANRAAPHRALHAIPIALILILATFLRIHGIAHDSLWGDETCTVMLARMPVVELVKTNVWWEQIPPLHHLIIHFWIKLFGDSEFSVRLPSAIAGVAGVWILYLLVRRLLDPHAALGAMLLLAVSPMHIAYSQESRSYTLAVLLCITSLDLFVRMLNKPTKRLQFFWVIVTALSLWAHLYSIFTVVVQHLIYAWQLWRRRKELPLRPRDWIINNVAAALLFSPWVPTVILWTRSVAMNFWVKKVTLDDISRSYWMFSGSTLVYLFMIALAVIGVARWWRDKRFGIVVLALVMLAPIVVPCVISVLTRPSFSPRYGIMGCIGLCAVAGAGLAALPRALRLPLIVLLAVASPMGNAAVIPRAQWREAGAFMTAGMRPNDIPVIHCSAGIRLYRYYVNRPDCHPHPTDTDSLPVTLPLDGRRIWLVIYDPWHTANDFLRRCPLRIERRYFSWGVLVLELTDEGSAATQPVPTQPVTPEPPRGDRS